jgi:hypothetical protein
MTATGKGYSSQWFDFRIGPDARREVWAYGSNEACTVTVSLSDKGLLTVSLRGY